MEREEQKVTIQHTHAGHRRMIIRMMTGCHQQESMMSDAAQSGQQQ